MNEEQYNDINERKPYQNSEVPLRWFHFVIYIQLFAAAFVLLGDAFMSISGWGQVPYEYMRNADIRDAFIRQIYYEFPNLKILDVAVGIGEIGVAVAMLVARSKLAKFKTGAPKWYIVAYVINLALNVLYMIGLSVLVGINISDMSFISSTIMSCILIWANYIYFSKRDFLFTN